MASEATSATGSLKTLNGRIKQKYDTEANWNSNNPLLSAGELAIVVTSDGIRVKVGDGSTRFQRLSYIDEFIQDYVDDEISTHTHNYAGSSTVGGAATSATKLATARTIGLSDAVTATAKSFDGTGNITIPVDTLKEAYLTWGGKNLKSSFGPLDAALIPVLGANRLAFMPADAITIEYSRDGGTTWTDYGVSDGTKIKLVSGLDSNIYIGNDSTSGVDKTNYMVRVKLDCVTGNLYTVLEKIALLVTTNGSTGSYCTIEGQTRANYAAGTDEWTTIVDKQSIGGWSGWNIINKSILVSKSSGNESYRYGAIRFVFGVTSHASSVAYSGLQIMKIMAFGGVGWNTPSTMAATGNIFSYDRSQGVTFPANVTATNFIGYLSGTASSAKKDVNGNYIVDTYATKTELENAVAELKTLINQMKGFASTESDM